MTKLTVRPCLLCSDEDVSHGPGGARDHTVLQTPDITGPESASQPAPTLGNYLTATGGGSSQGKPRKAEDLIKISWWSEPASQTCHGGNSVTTQLSCIYWTT